MGIEEIQSLVLDKHLTVVAWKTIFCFEIVASLGCVYQIP